MKPTDAFLEDRHAEAIFAGGASEAAESLKRELLDDGIEGLQVRADCS